MIVVVTLLVDHTNVHISSNDVPQQCITVMQLRDAGASNAINFLSYSKFPTCKDCSTICKDKSISILIRYYHQGHATV